MKEKKDRFMEALEKRTKTKYYWINQIPGTDKTISYFPGSSWIYSEESDLDVILKNEERAFGKSKILKKNYLLYSYKI